MLRKVFKRVLENGLTVLTVPLNLIPKVSIQLWYNVGSKDEKTGEKGIAHFIEHMIFKGTKTLSECDINLITSKLSGYCNAFTSYDYTGYLFEFPTQNWSESLPIMADCMRNCTFNEQFLNSELKAVIQELKMYKDEYSSELIVDLISTIFQDHPYHNPIIGYKQDLWSLKRDNLLNFYNYHYIPNNATLVVVGDVQPEEVFKLAQENFGDIAPNFDYKKEEFYHSFDIKGYQVKIYRDIKQPIVILSWVIPGLNKKQNYLADIVSRIVGFGKGSRLYKKLVNKLELVTEIEAFVDELFEYSLFSIYFRPKRSQDIEYIVELINQDLDDIISDNNGISQDDILRAIRKTETDYVALLESNRKQAYEIGKYFLATGDEQYFYNYTDHKKEDLLSQIKEFIFKYLKADILSQGQVLPIKDKYKSYWAELQELSDQEDNRILSNIKREEEIQEGKCVYSIKVKPPIPFSYPKAQIDYLKNGLKLLYYNNSNLPKIDMILDFKSKYYYDPIEYQGLSNFTADMLEEGTKNYTADQFSDILDVYGINFYSEAGILGISLLSQDFAKSLELLNDVLVQASFNDEAIDRVREQLLSEINQFWDKPIKFVNQIARQEIYKDHPYSKNPLGTIESIKRIDRDLLINHYKNCLSPKGSKLAIVGDLSRYDVVDCVNHMVNVWQGDAIEDINWPIIEPVKYKEINYKIMRDQTVLCYAGLSVNRKDKDYDKLLLFDQIFTGGVLGSMSSYLFDLRERSGLFYTIGGSLVNNSDLEPGLIIVKTIVSNDNLNIAEKSIENLINISIDKVTQSEFTEAKNSIINSLVDLFSTNYRIASTFLSKDNYEFPQDYFDHRVQEILNIDLDDMKTTVKKYLSIDKLIKIRAGRV
ncbi:MAG: insulinase family protein [Novosphingobium sp.]|nr:insulinase family protein [Novosphingobium sp.]